MPFEQFVTPDGLHMNDGVRLRAQAACRLDPWGGRQADSATAKATTAQ